jgi:hypothetical protein
VVVVVVVVVTVIVKAIRMGKARAVSADQAAQASSAWSRLCVFQVEDSRRRSTLSCHLAGKGSTVLVLSEVEAKSNIRSRVKDESLLWNYHIY